MCNVVLSRRESYCKEYIGYFNEASEPHIDFECFGGLCSWKYLVYSILYPLAMHGVIFILIHHRLYLK